MLNLKHLYYFHVFSHELSTTKAARRLAITTSALSIQLKQLEGFLGVSLTRRDAGKVILTEHGDIVQHYSDKMFSAYEELKKRLTVSRDLRNSCFRVGICRNIGPQFSFDLLSLIEKSNLGLSKNVQITFDSTERVHAGFLKDEFDLILGTYSRESPEENDAISESLSFPVRLFGPASLRKRTDELAKKQPLTDPAEIMELANSMKISLVLPMLPSVLREQTEEFLSRSSVRPSRTIECNGSGAIVQLIERGFAMGFVPAPCLLDFKSAGQLAVLGPSEGYWTHGVSVYLHKGPEGVENKFPGLADAFQDPYGPF